MNDLKLSSSSAPWRHKLHEIIFEAETPAGRAFDIALFITIGLSTLIVILESVSNIRANYRLTFLILEWCITGLFTVEYILRLLSVYHPARYAISFFGLIDLFAVLPTYLSLFIPGSQYLLVIRIVRLLRIFRVLKLAEYLNEAAQLQQALRASRRKISVFLLTVLMLVVIIGALMYVIEGEAHGFRDIPTSIYWAIVTLTTVGYGDIAPQTTLGQLLASAVMLLGYGIIAVPTGIVTIELSRTTRTPVSTQACPVCGREGHDYDAVHCKYCGAKL
jgi:voltage-gated potassium channel